MVMGLFNFNDPAASDNNVPDSDPRDSGNFERQFALDASQSSSHYSAYYHYYRLPTVGNRAFTVAGPRVWHTLPEDITTSRSLSAFCQRLKTWLFRKSYPDIII